jgi:Tol biopolymer transport system component
VADALTPGVTGDGRTIVFVSTSASNELNLWTADANGRRMTQLAPNVSAGQVLVAPDDRSVLFTSLVGGTVSIWTVAIGGGTPTKLTDGGFPAVSPDGRSMAFTTQTADGRSLLVVCSLPECTSHRTIGAAPFESAVAWTPDGRGVAFVRDGNLWVQPAAGSAPRQLTRFSESRPIGAFAWSRDGKRLAITRSTVTNDIVLVRGLK